MMTHVYSSSFYWKKNTKGNIRFGNEKQANFLDEDVQYIYCSTCYFLLKCAIEEYLCEYEAYWL